MKVLTAYNLKHEPYIDSCKRAVKSEHYLQFDCGLGKVWAMNKLLSRVNDNDILIMCDADDFLSPEVFDVDVDADVIYGDARLIDSNGNLSYFKSKEFDIDLFKQQNFIPFSGTIVKGWLAKKVMYPDLFPVEDWVWWHRLYQYSDNFKYSGVEHVTRRVWTSSVNRYIPIYSKVRRLVNNYKARQIIKKIYEP